jgi:hypothetical protein
MTAHVNSQNTIALDDAELEFVTGGSTLVAIDPRVLAAEKLTAIQPIHLNPLRPLHTALTHF